VASVTARAQPRRRPVLLLVQGPPFVRLPVSAATVNRVTDAGFAAELGRALLERAIHLRIEGESTEKHVAFGVRSNC